MFIWTIHDVLFFTLLGLALVLLVLAWLIYWLRYWLHFLAGWLKKVTRRFSYVWGN